MGLLIENTQGAEGVAVRGAQGHSGVEAHLGGARHQGVVEEAIILGGVGHHHYRVLVDGVGAEGDIAAHIHVANTYGGGENTWSEPIIFTAAIGMANMWEAI